MFIVSLILFAIAALAVWLLPKEKVVKKAETRSVTARDPNGRMVVTEQETAPAQTTNAKILAIIPLILALLFLAASCITTVGARNVGVETFYGKTTGRKLGAGPHLKLPWNSVTDVDGTIHVKEYHGKSCIDVKIADGGTGCVSLAYRWRVNSENAPQAYQDYKNSDDDIDVALRKALVSTNIKPAINEVFSSFDPLGDVVVDPDMSAKELAKIKVNVNPDYESFNARVLSNVRSKIASTGDLVEIQSITISYFKLPDATQERIDAFNKAVQNTRITLQEVGTKTAQADGNRELAASLRDPNVLVSKCLDSLASGEFTAPAGFSCWPGTGSAVVLPAAGKN